MQTNTLSCVDINISSLPREVLLRFVLLLEVTKRGISSEFSTRELDILVFLYLIDGIDDAQQMSEFITNCFNKNLTRVKSAQSIRNVLTKARDHKLVKRKSVNNWKVDILPPLDEVFILRSILTNYDIS